MPTNLVIDLLGWGGAVAVLVAYALVSAGRVSGRSGVYQLLNAGGSALLMANTYYYRAYPSTFVNVLWLGIAAYALTTREKGKGKRERSAG